MNVKDKHINFGIHVTNSIFFSTECSVNKFCYKDTIKYDKLIFRCKFICQLVFEQTSSSLSDDVFRYLRSYVFLGGFSWSKIYFNGYPWSIYSDAINKIALLKVHFRWKGARRLHKYGHPGSRGVAPKELFFSSRCKLRISSRETYAVMG